MSHKICALLNQNHIGIIEHDTIPGIVAKMNEENAKKIIQIKKRAPEKGFIILISNMQQLKDLTETIQPETDHIIKSFWPGPLTIVLKKSKLVPPIITGYHSTIAIRFPKHPILNDILTQLNCPLISTSANISGETEMSQELLNNVDFCYGNIHSQKNTVSSTIIDGTVSPPSVLRQGSIKIN
jgi:L-threonylcarbamoyladenylate synthase